jgi:hypothetical protein
MRRESGVFVRYAGTALLVVLFGVPVLLLITTSWPHIVVGGATVVAVSYAFGLYRTGYEAGYRARDEYGCDQAVAAVRCQATTSTTGVLVNDPGRTVWCELPNGHAGRHHGTIPQPGHPDATVDWPILTEVQTNA